ncbi:MAG: LamG domain-containing protein, partial [Myxococcales bacterium]|nr:LamG domain-containing protein [Myxococcales bacterium]
MSDKYLAFEGTPTKVDVGTVTSLGLVGDFTIELYVLFDAGLATGCILCIGDESANAVGRLALLLAENKSLLIEHGSQEITGAIIDKVGARIQLALSYDSATRKVTLHVNGERYSDAVLVQAFSPDTTARVVLGASRSSARHFSGGMTELRIFNVVRSQARIKGEMFCRLSGIEDGLTGYFPLDGQEGESGGTARDAKVELDPRTQEPVQSPRPSARVSGGVWKPSDLPLHRSERSGESGKVVVGGFTRSEVFIKRHESVLETPTIEAWVRPTGTSRPYYTYPVVSQHATRKGWELRAGGGKGGFLVTIGNTYHEIVVPLENDVWHFLTASYDGVDLRFYVNGLLR